MQLKSCIILFSCGAAALAAAAPIAERSADRSFRSQAFELSFSEQQNEMGNGATSMIWRRQWRSAAAASGAAKLRNAAMTHSVINTMSKKAAATKTLGGVPQQPKLGAKANEPAIPIAYPPANIPVGNTSMNPNHHNQAGGKDVSGAAAAAGSGGGGGMMNYLMMGSMALPMLPMITGSGGEASTPRGVDAATGGPVGTQTGTSLFTPMGT